jgi:hypothetical protein
MISRIYFLRPVHISVPTLTHKLYTTPSLLVILTRIDKKDRLNLSVIATCKAPACKDFMEGQVKRLGFLISQLEEIR